MWRKNELMEDKNRVPQHGWSRKPSRKWWHLSPEGCEGDQRREGGKWGAEMKSKWKDPGVLRSLELSLMADLEGSDPTWLPSGRVSPPGSWGSHSHRGQEWPHPGWGWCWCREGEGRGLERIWLPPPHTGGTPGHSILNWVPGGNRLQDAGHHFALSPTLFRLQRGRGEPTSHYKATCLGWQSPDRAGFSCKKCDRFPRKSQSLPSDGVGCAVFQILPGQAFCKCCSGDLKARSIPSG